MSDGQQRIVAERAELYAEAVSRAGLDLAFRERLIETPGETLDALAEELGLEARVPVGVCIGILDDAHEKLYLTLPPAPEAPLSETELERVAGGIRAVRDLGRTSGDAHGCPACPHLAAGPTFKTQ